MSLAGGLDARLSALGEAARLADGRLDTALVDEAEGVVRRAGERLGHGLEATVVALAGPTGAGKSTLFNALAGRDLVAVGVRRPTTSATTAAVWGFAPELLDWLEIHGRHAVAGDPEGLVLLDLPDFDSVETSHRLEVERLVPLVDLLVWVVDPQKYADAALHERYLHPLRSHAGSMLVVLNQADRLGDGIGAAAGDLRSVLAADGLGEVPVLPLSARTGEGMPELRQAIEERVERREAAVARLAADVDDSATRLRAAAGDGHGGEVDRRQREQLAASLAEAAGVPAVVAAVGRAHRRRGALATGVPWVAWVRRLRPDPLRRLGLGDAPQEDVRTSLPRATPVQRAHVDSAVRRLAGEVASDLPAEWLGLARRAATAREEELADRLDRAIAGAELGLTRPRWWTAARWLQRLLAVVAAAGALWLLALAVLGFVQLGDVVPTPEYNGFPVPTLLLLVGLGGALLVAFVAGRLNGVGARRRARRAERALRERVGAVADELVIAPLTAELGARDELLNALDAAQPRERGGLTGRLRRSARPRERAVQAG
ncbi:MAG TPA: YfjP family GTPase [Solirubrobacteraceae bacterium]|jgi:GTP-binding protein EngB required for normal cell division|nr:YfjP family GTPase [Solirubrobacteraceae bacterium]